MYILHKYNPYRYTCDKWFSHITCLLARYENNNCFCIIGDFNSRIGRESDSIETVDEDLINKRLCIDNVVNGRSLLDLLIENSLYVLNGRFGPDSSISTKDSAVVHYVIARQSDVHLFLKLQINAMSEIFRIPDHSIISCDIIVSDYTLGNSLSDYQLK